MKDIFDQYGGIALGVVSGFFCVSFLYVFISADNGMLLRFVLDYIGIYLGGANG